MAEVAVRGQYSRKPGKSRASKTSDPTDMKVGALAGHTARGAKGRIEETGGQCSTYSGTEKCLLLVELSGEGEVEGERGKERAGEEGQG